MPSQPPTPSQRSTLPTPPTPPTHATASRTRRLRPEGQWALGQTEPLNANERYKAADNGLNVRGRIETLYAHQGFASIPPEDLRGRMRWWGLYTQRRPGIPGGKTAALAPEDLDDSYFMLRVRIDGGALTSAQTRAIGEVSTRFARDTADITDRQNVQLHWIRIEDVPSIWRHLEEVGISTTEACGDTPRTILGSPVAGVAADEIIDGTQAIQQIARRFIGDPDFANLPRKFKTAISGSPRQDVVHETNDVSFIGVVHPEHGPGFDVWVGGGLSTVPKSAVRLGAWVPLEQVADVWQGVVSIFRDYGYRRVRNRARMKFLVADWGPEKFRDVLETEYLRRPLRDGPAPPTPLPQDRDHIGIHPQRDGLFYVGAAPTVGRVSGTLLSRIADLAEEHGSGRIRLTPHQKLIILDVPDDRTAKVADELLTLGLYVTPSTFRRSTMACTGIEYCKLAISETKVRAATLIDELERRRPGLDLPLTISVNGCPNSCARFQGADIGLKGVLTADHEGRQTEGYSVHLGGSDEDFSESGRTPRGLRVVSDDLPEYVDRLLGRFLTGRVDSETFAEWSLRADEEELR